MAFLTRMSSQTLQTGPRVFFALASMNVLINFTHVAQFKVKLPISDSQLNLCLFYGFI